jgi:glycosyltransferase involved in cell wall biosynthesis
MIICQYSPYLYPAKASAGAERYCEALCRGLVKLGHKVYLYGKEGSQTNTGAIVVNSVPDDTDIIHVQGFGPEHSYNHFKQPWVGTIHGGGGLGMESSPQWLKSMDNHPNAICVSKFVSDRINCPAYVNSFVSEEDFMFVPNKMGYFIHIAGFGWEWGKGLDTFIMIAKKMKWLQFRIAGAGGRPEFAEHIKKICSQEPNIKFIGEINGDNKTAYLAPASALLFPTKLPEAGALVIPEAFMCGTPVIGSKNGCLPEYINEKVGFTCETEADYIKAILNIKKIDTNYVRQYALDNHSDIAGAKKYLQYYENMIKNRRVV